MCERALWIDSAANIYDQRTSACGDQEPNHGLATLFHCQLQRRVAETIRRVEVLRVALPVVLLIFAVNLSIGGGGTLIVAVEGALALARQVQKHLHDLSRK